jgi:hypothetical protein
MPAGKARSAACRVERRSRWEAGGHASASRRGRPTIARRSYEVDDGFLARFTASDPEQRALLRRRPLRPPSFDLEAFVLPASPPRA